MRGDRTCALVIAGLAVGLILLIGSLLAWGEAITALQLIREDGPYESLGALASLAAGVTFLYLAFHAPGRDSTNEAQPPRRWWYAVLGIGLITMFVEEISWGQRVLGFSTPEWLENENRQQEFNLHNLFLFNPQYDFNWLKLLWSAGSTIYLGLFSVVAALSRRFRTFLDRIGVPIAHWPIGVVMLGAVAWYLYETEQAAVWGNHFAGHAVGETFEVVIELLFLALALQCLCERIPQHRTWWLLISATVLPAVLLLGIGHFRSGPMGPDVLAAAELQQGIALFSKGKLPEALAHIQRSIEHFPSNPAAEFHAGIVCHSMNDLEAATDHFKAAIALDPAMIDACYNLGLVYLSTQHYALAEPQFKQMVDERPKDAEARFYWGISLKQLGETALAEQQFEEALRIRPTFEAARAELEALHAAP